MPAQNEVTIRITAEDNATSILKKIGIAVDDVGDKGQQNAPKVGGRGLGGAFKSLGAELKGFINPATAVAGATAALGTAFIAAAKYSFNAAREMESLRVQLKTVEGSSEAADRRLADLVQTGKEIAGLDLKGLVQFNSQLKNARLNSAETDVVMESVSKAMVEVGQGSAATARVLTQVTQAFAGNRIAAEDLKTLFADVGKATTAMQNVFGETATGVSEFREISEQLGLTAKQSLLLVFEELNRITEVDVNTTNAQWEIFNENMQALGATVGEPINAAVKETLKALNFLAEKTQEFFEWLDDERHFSNEEQEKLVQESNDRIVAIQDGAEKQVEAIQERKKLFIQSAVNDIKAGEIAASAETLEAISADYVRRGENATTLYELQREEIRKTIQAELNVLKIRIQGEQELTTKKLEEIQKRFADAGAYGETPEAQALMRQEMERVIKASEEKITGWKQEASLLAQQARKDIGAVDEQETTASTARAKSENESKKLFLEKHVADATTSYGQLEDAGNANTETLKNQSQAIYDNQVNLNNETIKDTNELYAANRVAAEAHTARLNDILGQQVDNAENAFDLIKDADATTKDDIEAKSQEIYDNQVALNNATIKNQEELNLANEKAAQQHTDRINKFADDRAKEEEKAAKTAEKANRDANKQIEKSNRIRAEQTKIELNRLTEDESISLQERINKNNQYYGFLTAAAIANIEDEKEKQDTIQLWNEKRIAANEELEKKYNENQSKRLADQAQAEKDAADAAEKRDKDLIQTKIANLNDLEQEQLGVIADLDAADDSSVEDRISATKRLFGIRLAKLDEDKANNKNYAADRKALLNDLRAEIRLILDGEQKDKEDAETAKRKAEQKSEDESKRIAKESLEISRDTYRDIVSNAESSADQINDAAQKLYDDKLKWIEANIDDEEEAARLILKAQEELDRNRTSSMEMFFNKYGEHLEATVDLALDTASRMIEISRTEANAKRDIQQDYLKSKIDFENEWAAAVAYYARVEGETRQLFQPQISKAEEEGRVEDAANLRKQMAEALGMDEDGNPLEGEFRGLLKERTDALQDLTDELNGASRDYFGALRQIQHDAKKSSNRLVWDTIGEGLGIAIDAAGTYFGAPPGSLDPLKDLVTFGTTQIGNIREDQITDQFLKEQIGIYKTQSNALINAQKEYNNASRAARELIRGTDADPAVIAQNMADAEAAAADRVRKIRDDEIKDLRFSVDSKKRNLDLQWDNQNISNQALETLYNEIYEKQKLILGLTIKDARDYKEAVVRLSWERTAELNRIRSRGLEDQQEAADESTEIEEKRVDTTVTTSKKEIDNLKWDVEQKKRLYDRASRDANIGQKALTDAFNDWHNARTALMRKEITDQEEATRESTRLGWKKVDELEKIAKRFKKTTADAETPEEDLTGTTLEGLRMGLAQLDRQLRDYQKTEEASLTRHEYLLNQHYAKRQQIIILSVDDENKRKLDLYKLETDRLAAIDALREKYANINKQRIQDEADAEEKAEEEKRQEKLSTLRVELVEERYAMDQVLRDEESSLEARQSAIASYYAKKREFVELDVENERVRSVEISRLLDEETAKRNRLIEANKKHNEELAAEKKKLEIDRLKFNVAQTQFNMEQQLALETSTQEQRIGAAKAFYAAKQLLVLAEIEDENRRNLEIEKLTAALQDKIASIQKIFQDRQTEKADEEIKKKEKDLNYQVALTRFAMEEILRNEQSSIENRLRLVKNYYEAQRNLVQATVKDEEQRGLEIAKLISEEFQRLEQIQKDYDDRLKEAADKKSEDARKKLLDDLRFNLAQNQLFLEQVLNMEDSTESARIAAATVFYESKRKLAEASIEEERERSLEFIRINREEEERIAKIKQHFIDEEEKRTKDLHEDKLDSLRLETARLQFAMEQALRDEKATLEQRKAAIKAFYEAKKAFTREDIEDAAKETLELEKMEDELKQRLAKLQEEHDQALADAEAEKLEKIRDNLTAEEKEEQDRLARKVRENKVTLDEITQEDKTNFDKRETLTNAYYDSLIKQAEFLIANEEDKDIKIREIELARTKAIQSLNEAEARHLAELNKGKEESNRETAGKSVQVTKEASEEIKKAQSEAAAHQKMLLKDVEVFNREVVTAVVADTTEHFKEIKENYKTHFSEISTLRSFDIEDNYDYLKLIREDTQYILGEIEKDYETHFGNIKTKADEAYTYINNKKSAGSRSYVGAGRTRGNLASRRNAALNKKKAKPEAMVVEMYADYGDGHQKKMGQGIAQQKKDRRVTPNV